MCKIDGDELVWDEAPAHSVAADDRRYRRGSRAGDPDQLRHAGQPWRQYGQHGYHGRALPFTSPSIADGALFGCGDMHAVMGDGEISVSGAEAAGWATVTLGRPCPKLALDRSPHRERDASRRHRLGRDIGCRGRPRGARDGRSHLRPHGRRLPDRGGHAAVPCRPTYRCARWWIRRRRFASWCPNTCWTALGLQAVEASS